MWSFLAEFTKNLGGTHTVVVMDDRGMKQPRHYEVQPGRVLAAWGGSMAIAALLVASLVVFTPIRQLIPGYGTDEIRRTARLNNLRVTALSDSVRAQQRYIEHLRGMMTGRLDTMLVANVATPDEDVAEPVPSPSSASGPEPSEDWDDHQQPALPMSQMPAQVMPAVALSDQPSTLARLQLPMHPPVEGFPTRGFDARTGHYAVDIAVEEGTPIRSVGDGYVIFADWTQGGGYTIAVQHANGFTAIYKHNERLLKRVGDRVQSRETIAMSGNTGEITTGPHLHFEFWHNGLAQDPRQYFVGW